MVTRPCLRSLDKPIVALWGLEPLDLFAILGVLLFMMGILAEVMLRIYYDSPQRSPYMLKDTLENE